MRCPASMRSCKPPGSNENPRGGLKTPMRCETKPAGAEHGRHERPAYPCHDPLLGDHELHFDRILAANATGCHPFCRQRRLTWTTMSWMMTLMHRTYQPLTLHDCPSCLQFVSLATLQVHLTGLYTVRLHIVATHLHTRMLIRTHSCLCAMPADMQHPRRCHQQFADGLLQACVPRSRPREHRCHLTQHQQPAVHVCNC